MKDKAKINKKAVVIISTVLILLLGFAYLISAVRISFAEYKFIADFNSGLSAFEYAPLNPKLERKFTFESATFKASYSKNKIVYQVQNPSEGLLAEREAFDEIYALYYDSFTEYNKQTAIGDVGSDNSTNLQNIGIWISGFKYIVTFDLSGIPTIIYEKTAVA
ncbi:MAG: hypothetical protein IJR70_04465 [Eubacterium sp.]|nr:hypothetical protein [Eubacterium sp.]